MTAYHEAGHAVVTYFLKDMDSVHRISIISRGGSLGHTLIPPKTDRYTETQSHLVAQIASLLGDRTAEKLIFNELTGGGERYFPGNGTRQGDGSQDGHEWFGAD